MRHVGDKCTVTVMPDGVSEGVGTVISSAAGFSEWHVIRVREARLFISFLTQRRKDAKRASPSQRVRLAINITANSTKLGVLASWREIKVSP
jgi:hypothetical protein